MVCLPALVLALSLGADPTAPAVAEHASRTVSVRIHDYAHLDEQDLIEAERLVSAIYEAVGVLLDWRAPVRPADVERGLRTWPTDGRPALTILAITSGMSRRLGIQTGVAGYAAVSPEQGGRLCFIVADRTAATARRAELAHTRVLSSVIRCGIRGSSPTGCRRRSPATRLATSAAPSRGSPPASRPAPTSPGRRGRPLSAACVAARAPDNLANKCGPVPG